MNCLHCHEIIIENNHLINIFQKRSLLCHRCLDEYESLRVNEKFKFDDMNVHTLFNYEGIVKRMLRRYKFQGDAVQSKVISMFIKSHLRLYEIIVPVPISDVRLKERGFNQVTKILDELNVKYTDCLTSSRVKRQSEMSKIDRENEKNPFSLKDGNYLIKNKSILIVDDIFTTGETVRQVAEILRQKQPKSINVLTFSISGKF